MDKKTPNEKRELICVTHRHALLDSFRPWPDLVTLRDKSRKSSAFLGRLGYLPPGGKFGLKSGLRKNLPKGSFSAEDYNLPIILSPALRRCFFEVCVFVFVF